jgi:hypothetical protein
MIVALLLAPLAALASEALKLDRAPTAPPTRPPCRTAPSCS